MTLAAYVCGSVIGLGSRLLNPERSKELSQMKPSSPIFSPVIEYVTEEVWRQGHDPRTLDGIQRTAWMLEAWSLALESAHPKPSIRDAEDFGMLVEPHMNQAGFRHFYVTVGGRSCPPPQQVVGLLTALFLQRDALAPLEFYKGFEEIHPFGDGNGRTGKILLNWLNGTLLDPIFPPSDLWGHNVRNP